MAFCILYHVVGGIMRKYIPPDYKATQSLLSHHMFLFAWDGPGLRLLSGVIINSALFNSQVSQFR